MAHWDSSLMQIVSWPSRESEYYSNWIEIDCGCCNGLSWGGETPRECTRCQGVGVLYKHKKSGVLALYPGGPFAGKEAPELVI